uniref:Cop protein n=1 Tax=Mammaliicoccus sciuri TaxID=1296 RepID=B2Z6N6_MAMSC|nr:cop protein [Mammaliicoccus sciuri]
MTFNKFLKYLISLFFLSILFHVITHKNNLVFTNYDNKKSCFFPFLCMFFTSHLKRYINRYEKATFFALKTSHTNNLRVTSLAGNSYPYYQDKKEKDFSLCSNPLKKHKRPHFLMWSFILQLKHPLVQQTKIG